MLKKFKSPAITVACSLDVLGKVVSSWGLHHSDHLQYEREEERKKLQEGAGERGSNKRLS